MVATAASDGIIRLWDLRMTDVPGRFQPVRAARARAAAHSCTLRVLHKCPPHLPLCILQCILSCVWAKIQQTSCPGQVEIKTGIPDSRAHTLLLARKQAAQGKPNLKAILNACAQSLPCMAMFNLAISASAKSPPLPGSPASVQRPKLRPQQTNQQNPVA